MGKNTRFEFRCDEEFKNLVGNLAMKRGFKEVSRYINYLVINDRNSLRKNDYLQYIDNYIEHLQEIGKVFIDDENIEELQLVLKNRGYDTEFISTDRDFLKLIPTENYKKSLKGKKWGELTKIQKDTLLKEATCVDATGNSTNGDCIVDFNELSIAGRCVIGEEENIIEIDDESVLYDSEE